MTAARRAWLAVDAAYLIGVGVASIIASDWSMWAKIPAVVIAVISLAGAHAYVEFTVTR